MDTVDQKFEKPCADFHAHLKEQYLYTWAQENIKNYPEVNGMKDQNEFLASLEKCIKKPRKPQPVQE